MNVPGHLHPLDLSLSAVPEQGSSCDPEAAGHHPSQPSLPVATHLWVFSGLSSLLSTPEASATPIGKPRCGQTTSPLQLGGPTPATLSFHPLPFPFRLHSMEMVGPTSLLWGHMRPFSLGIPDTSVGLARVAV